MSTSRRDAPTSSRKKPAPTMAAVIAIAGSCDDLLDEGVVRHPQREGEGRSGSRRPRRGRARARRTRWPARRTSSPSLRSSPSPACCSWRPRRRVHRQDLGLQREEERVHRAVGGDAVEEGLLRDGERHGCAAGGKKIDGSGRTRSSRRARVGAPSASLEDEGCDLKSSNRQDPLRPVLAHRLHATHRDVAVGEHELPASGGGAPDAALPGSGGQRRPATSTSSRNSSALHHPAEDAGRAEGGAPTVREGAVREADHALAGRDEASCARTSRWCACC